MLLVACLLAYVAYQLLLRPRFNPLLRLAGPNPGGLFKSNLQPVMSPSVSPRAHETYVHHFGRSFRIRGVGPLDERLLTLDPLSVSHVLKNSSLYEKPWQSRALITSMIGCGMLAAEGQVHKRQRRVATPAFSIQNLRKLVPLVFKKGTELKDKWTEMISAEHLEEDGKVIDVCHWISRATFDVIGVAGFDYQFNAIQNETNELFSAYKDMFEVAISQGSEFSTILSIYAPWWFKIFPNNVSRTVDRCQNVIRKVAGELIQDKKRKIEEGQKSGKPYQGRDLLSLLLKSNVAVDLPEDQRISDEDILNNVNTFMFAGSDTSSLTLTWTLWLLAENPQAQDRLRAELLDAFPDQITDVSDLNEDEIQSMNETLSHLPLLHNIIQESVRLVPPVHSSIRVATEDDEIPTMYPVKLADGSTDVKKSVSISKGSFIHVAVEGFNLDKEFWGPDAWEFNPDRWDDLPEAASKLPGLFANTLTFSAGPRSCIGMRFSMIEIKTFLYILLTRFVFKSTEDKIIKSNVVLTRPYIAGKYRDGSQLPLIVSPYIASKH
ncbi:cytochrome-450 hydroxylase [Coprinopsis marcescibilis]|uniref:Cytochrome-450 hydroxylase n=1 Tax=Coprinopsis marcescibilis TaxID=230819 RepID=A0A5C3KQA8_COPMA|nr:cytochrome-450 hydroxylase [Coprinopsis marcescibilis]